MYCSISCVGSWIGACMTPGNVSKPCTASCTRQYLQGYPCMMMNSYPVASTVCPDCTTGAMAAFVCSVAEAQAATWPLPCHTLLASAG